MRSANGSVQYSTRLENPRARTCGCNRLRPIDGEKRGPNGIDTSTTSVMVVMSGSLWLRPERRRFARGCGRERMTRVAALPCSHEIRVRLSCFSCLTRRAERARQLQFCERVQRMCRLIPAADDHVAELARRFRGVVDGGMGEAADVGQPGADHAVVGR